MNWRDKQLWAALVAAPVFWAGLYLLTEPVLSLAWPLYRPLMFLSLAVLYPVLEEIVFRGLIQDFFNRIFRRYLLGILSLANLVTSVLFVTLHFFYQPPLWAASVFIPSLLFGYFRERHNSLWAPIGLHCFYNAGYFWLFGA